VTIRPRVSVVIPLAGAGSRLHETLESVRVQTFRAFEILIVSDGTADHEATAAAVCEKRPDTQLVTAARRGVAAAVNHGLALAAGDYVSVVPAGDTLAPTLFESAVPLLDEEPSLTWVSCWVEAAGSDAWTPGRCDLETLLSECTICTAAPVRRSAALALGGFNEQIDAVHDWAFWIALAQQGFAGVILPEVLCSSPRARDSMASGAWPARSPAESWSLLVRTCPEAYRAHLVAVLRRKEQESVSLLRDTASLERRINTWLIPTLERRQDEQRRLSARLGETQQEPGSHLPRGGWRSWRVVEPLRPAYRRMRRTAASLRAKLS
jgi:hypothetical protein